MSFILFKGRIYFKVEGLFSYFAMCAGSTAFAATPHLFLIIIAIIINQLNSHMLFYIKKCVCLRKV